MELIDQEVIAALREEVLNPVVIDRALAKLQRRLQQRPKATTDRSGQLQADANRLGHELSRLSDAVAGGAPPSSVLDAIRDRKSRRADILAELAALQQDAAAMLDPLTEAIPEVRRRLAEWRSVIAEETTQTRQMLRELLHGRIVFTPQRNGRAVEFIAQLDYGRLIEAVIGLPLPQVLASPTGVAPFLRGRVERRAA